MITLRETDADIVAVSAEINQKLGYPKRGTHVGGGRHVAMPIDWDGQGECPPGWTKGAVAVALADDSATEELRVDARVEQQLQAFPETLAKIRTPSK
jgi:hypothetical protein